MGSVIGEFLDEIFLDKPGSKLFTLHGVVPIFPVHPYCQALGSIRFIRSRVAMGEPTPLSVKRLSLRTVKQHPS
jgi:hypothetical protein